MLFDLSLRKILFVLSSEEFLKPAFLENGKKV